MKVPIKTLFNVISHTHASRRPSSIDLAMERRVETPRAARDRGSTRLAPPRRSSDRSSLARAVDFPPLAMVAVGDQFPDVVAQSHEPSWPTPVKMRARLAGKKSLVVGLPGAFTPT